jgi:type VI secretion system protein ImpL
LQALHGFATQRPGVLDELLAALGKLATQLTAFEDATKRSVASTAPNLGEFAALLPRLPEPIRAWMQQLHTDAATQLAALQREAITQHVRREVLPLCTQQVAGRYPLVRASREEVSRQEFVRMFGANGVIDSTFRRHLANWVDTRAQPWSYRGSDDTRGEATDSLRQFQHARIVRDAFFRNDGKTLGVSLQWRLIGLDAGIRQFSIEIDGQGLRFAPESKTPVSIVWPGADAEAGVRVQVQGASGTPSSFTFSGTWALLRLLDRARVEPVDSAKMVATFDVEGRRARFEIASRGGPNPLRLSALERFECPQRR